jgi:alkylated DNA repair dioxygenase AlkB
LLHCKSIYESWKTVTQFFFETHFRKMEEIRRKTIEQDCEKLLKHKWSAVDMPRGKMYVDYPELLPSDGLYYEPNFMTEEEQKQAIELVDSNEFANVIARRQQFWGDVYYHTSHDLAAIQPVSQEKTDLNRLDIEQFRWLLDKLDSRVEEVAATPAGSCIYKGKQYDYAATPSGIFTATKDDSEELENADQILVNEYTGSMGIYGHLDDPFAFGKVIVMISLVCPVLMRFTQDDKVVKVLLEPGSLLVTKGQARHNYGHGISHHKWVAVNADDGKQVMYPRDDKYRRLSLTIRHLLDGRKRVPIERE